MSKKHNKLRIGSIPATMEADWIKTRTCPKNAYRSGSTADKIQHENFWFFLSDLRECTGLQYMQK